MILNRVIKWLIILFVVFYLVTQPTSAGHLISGAFHGIHAAGNSLAHFINALNL